MYFLRMAAMGYGTSFTGYLEFWTMHRQPALSGYSAGLVSVPRAAMDRLVQLVFLPGYPLAVRAAERVS
jgi:hypothetical protein